MTFDGRTIVRTRNLLYRDEVGRDACGIGGVAAREGKPSHEVVVKVADNDLVSIADETAGQLAADIAEANETDLHLSYGQPFYSDHGDRARGRSRKVRPTLPDF